MNVSLIYMASGFGKRYGTNKLLTEFQGEPLYLHGLLSLQKAARLLAEDKIRCELFLISQYERVLSGSFDRVPEAERIFNEDSDLGITASLKLGTEVSRKDTDAFLYCVADQPCMRGATIAEFVRGFLKSGKGIGCVCAKGHRGSPNLFAGKYKKELLALEGDQGGRQIMQENTELLLQLISDILDLAKIEAGTLDYNMGYVDVSDFCKDVMRNYDIKEDKAVPVLLAPDLPDYRIYTDKKRLMQVVTNFINNALKFTSEGQILLEYHPVEGTGQIEFSVTDTGMGIAPDAVATVFDRFVKLNTFAKGTGLGLSICKSIIEHLGGTIGTESELGVGSRFWFRHPCAE